MQSAASRDVVTPVLAVPGHGRQPFHPLRTALSVLAIGLGFFIEDADGNALIAVERKGMFAMGKAVFGDQIIMTAGGKEISIGRFVGKEARLVMIGPLMTIAWIKVQDGQKSTTLQYPIGLGNRLENFGPVYQVQAKTKVHQIHAGIAVRNVRRDRDVQVNVNIRKFIHAFAHSLGRRIDTMALRSKKLAEIRQFDAVATADFEDMPDTLTMTAQDALDRFVLVE